MRAMSNNTSAPAPVAATVSWDPDLIYATLGDPVRRRLLFALAKSGPKIGAELKVSGGRPLGATLKQLAALCKLGFVKKLPNPKDGRQPLYVIDPSVPVQDSPTGKCLHFGFTWSQV